MNLLAIDTATEACSVALLCNGQIDSRREVEPRIHSRVLLPMIDELMAAAGLSPQQLDAVAFGRGPGAFTGVRIATAAAQAITLGADIPALPVSNLAMLAHRAYREQGHKRIVAAIDARMDEVYCAAYQVADGETALVGDERVCSPTEVPPPRGTGWIACGTGWITWPAELFASTGAQIVEGVSPYPDALDLLTLGRVMLERGQGVAPEDALPVYLRDKVASTEAERRGAVTAGNPGS